MTTPQPTNSGTDPKPDATAAAPKPEPVVPDTYTFKAPSGREPDKALVDTFTPVFRELGLTQAQADKLVDAYNAQSKSDADKAVETIQAMGRKWESETKADPVLGPNLDKVKMQIGQALDMLPKEDVTAFRNAMNETMVGNHPAFIKTFWRMAEKMVAGTHVQGINPSPNGQSPSGHTERPSIAESMWPNLKTS